MIEWLRPAWLLALPAGLALAWAWWRTRAGSGLWRAQVDAELLDELAGRAPAASARRALGLAVAAYALVIVALAGPSWRTQPAPLHADAGARVVVLDLSPSMDAVDVAPSRLERARAAVGDLLRDAAGARLGLVVFGADAFSVAPLTADPAVLLHLIGGLATGTLPRAGSRPDLGLDMARALLEKSGAAAGEVILVGDSGGDERTLAAARALAGAGFPLSVLAVGTQLGGPVRVVGGAFARTVAGEVFIARPEFEALERVARAGGGSFRLLPAAGATPRVARAAPAWSESRIAGPGEARRDDGAWLALLALPFAALLFRRGWLACLAALALNLSLPAPQALAFDWPDLWHRADQQAAASFARARTGEEARIAARLSPDSPWRALLLYRAGRYGEAAALFATLDTADAHYNRGNALALAGRLEEALEAYDAALERRRAMSDALYNRSLVRAALEAQRARAGTGEQSRGQADDKARASSAAPGASSRARRGDAVWEEPGQLQQARERARDAAQPEDQSPEAAEMRRLEDLLAQVPDDPGTLLANRFAHQLNLRGAADRDTGGRW